MQKQALLVVQAPELVAPLGLVPAVGQVLAQVQELVRELGLVLVSVPVSELVQAQEQVLGQGQGLGQEQVLGQGLGLGQEQVLGQEQGLALGLGQEPLPFPL